MRDEDSLYDPRPIEDDQPPHAPAGTGYRIRSDAVWAQARAAYLDGETAEGVCDRFDLSLSAFRERARRGGWRRCDQPDGEPRPVDAMDDVDGCSIEMGASYAELADHALRQMRRAIARGRASEACSWMRLHERLLARAEAEAQAAVQAARRAEAAARPVSPELRALHDRVAARHATPFIPAAPPARADDPEPHEPHDPHPVFDGPALDPP